MTDSPRRLRRVVTGNDADGRSGVIYDSAAPNTRTLPTGAYFTEFWTVDQVPVDLSDARGGSDVAFSISPPARGLHFRIAQTPPESQLKVDTQSVAETQAPAAAGVTEHKADGPHWNMHRTASVDYAFCVGGERVLILEDSEVVLNKGDVVIQLGNWHSWSNRSDDLSSMAFLMIGGELPD